MAGNSNKILVLLIAVSVLHVSGDSAEEHGNGLTPLEEFITKELEKFSDMQKELANTKANLNITLVLSHTVLGENGMRVRNSVAFHPLVTKVDPDGMQVAETLNETMINSIFKFAEELEASGILSQEKYLEDGSLHSEDIYSENVHISYEDGDSSILLECTDGELSKENNPFEEFLNVLKEFELPAEVTDEIYNEKGEIIKTKTTDYKPTRVKILDSENMEVGVQMKVAEALKRVLVIKHTDAERMALLGRYLTLQFSDYTWKASVGEKDSSDKYDVSIKLALDDKTYIVTGE